MDKAAIFTLQGNGNYGNRLQNDTLQTAVEKLGGTESFHRNA